MTSPALNSSNTTEVADDIFISYSRSDGKPYAIGVEAALSKLGFSCFLDLRGTDAGRLLPETLFRKIRLCKTLVLLASPGAIERPENIAEEVREFAESNGTARIIPISFDGEGKLADWSKASWFKDVDGKPRERENASALKTGAPSSAIVEGIAKTSTYMKSKDRVQMELRNAVDQREKAVAQRKRILLGTLVLVILVGVGAPLFAAYESHLAISAKNEAAIARAQADKSNAMRKEAENTVIEATQRAQKVTELAKLADDRRIAAEQSADQAELQQAKAQANAKAQQAIADSRSLANGSQMILRQHPDQLPRSLSLAVEAFKKSPTVEADSALRASLGLFPRLLRTVKYEDNIFTTAFSPDGRYFATLSYDDRLRIYDANRQKLIKEIFCSGFRVALSNDATYAAVASNLTEEVRILSLKNNESSVIKTKHNADVRRLALSPGGKYLAITYTEELSPVMPSIVPPGAELLEVETGKRIKSWAEDFGMLVTDVAFAANGDLALAGVRGVMEEPHTSRIVIWSLSTKLQTGETEHELAESDFSDFVDVDVEEPVFTIALGVDSSVFATDKTVWRRTGIRKYEPVVRIPVVADEEKARQNYRVESVALNRDGAVNVVRPIRTYVPQTDPSSTKVTENEPRSLGKGYFLNQRLLEVWDATGHGEGMNMLQRSPVSRIGFEPGGKRVGILTSGFGESTVTIFNSATGTEFDAVRVASQQSLEKIAAASSNLDFIVVKGEKTVRVYNVWKSKTFSVPYDATLPPPSLVTISSDGRFLALVSQDEKAKNQQLEEASKDPEERSEGAPADAVVYRLNGNSYVRMAHLRLIGIPRLVILSPDGRFLATRIIKPNFDEVVRVYSIADGTDFTFTTLRKVDRVGWLEFSPDGRFLLVLDSSHENQSRLTRVWRFPDGVEISTLSHAKSVVNYVFSSSGRYLLDVGSDGVTRLVDLSTGYVKRVAEGAQVYSAAFSPDDQYLGVADDIGLLRVYRTDKNIEVARIQHDEPLAMIAFSFDNRFVATATSNFKAYRFRSLPESKDSKPSDEFDRLDAATDNRFRVWPLRRSDLLAAASTRIASLPAYAR